ncbi:TIGR02588 family protein [Mastigocoleus testarum]|uniref:TIGR02588 family protein n=1 Tax=Mastigocoleus testarum BC008 TaxID=371196 RepID=A0A0V7ZRM6_9CYAN|nr:TIGR02588 family protein [Mastigocoleus testarum]KST66854.1 hypothetical protein BC008_27075 [Mastigocoleus testarum BC008]KST70192.1 hypothetical protein BC008_36680 [Mastigocoleus testarum BC008]
MIDTEKGRDTRELQKRSFAEWLTFSVASSLLIVVISLVGFTWFQDSQQEPPILIVTREKAMRKENGHFYVPFKILNKGGKTAASVQIIAELSFNGEVEQTGQQEIDFLSRKEKKEGAFIFTKNPQEGELMIRVASYKLP